MAIEVASAAVKIEPDFTGFAGAVGTGVRSQTRQVGAAAQQLGAGLTAAVTLPIAAVGAAAVKSFADFDEALTSSLAIVQDFGTTTREDFEQTARDVARATTFSATEAAEAYFFLASAGLSAETQLAALPQVARFAQAGNFDLATATDLATDAQSALGLSSDDTAESLENLARVQDVLVKANTLANATVEQFATSLTNKAGTALKLLGKDIEEGVAVLAVYADQGIKGQIAGENLSRVLKGLDINARANAEEFEALGIEVFDAAGEMVNIADIAEDLTEALGDLSDEERGAAIEALGFTARQQDVIKTLIGTEDQIRAYEEALRDANGITDEIANRQLQSFSAQLSIARSRLTDAAITIGEDLAPAILGLTQAVATVADFFVALPDPIKRTITILAGFAAAAGPILLIGGRLAQAVVALRTLRVTSGRGASQALAYAAAQRQAAVSTAALGAAATRAAPAVTGLAGAQSAAVGGRVNTSLVRGGGAAAVTGLAAGGGGRLAGIGAGVAAGGRLALRGAGAAGLGFLGGDLLGSLVQGFETEEGTTGDAIKDSIGNAVRFGVTGAAAGFAVGGPVGAAVGGVGGAVVGGLVGFFRSDRSGEEISEAVEETVRSRIADALEGLQLSERELQAAAQTLDTAIQTVIITGVQEGLTSVEAAGLGDRAEKIVADLLDQGFDATEVADSLATVFNEGVNGGLSDLEITDAVIADIQAKAATSLNEAVSGVGGIFVEELQPEFQTVFGEALAAGGSTIEAFNAGIAANARDLDLSLVADSFIGELAAIPSIFGETFDEARSVSSEKLLELAQANAEGAAAFTDNIRTLTEAGLVTLADQIVQKGPAAAAEAEALAGDLETALQIEGTLRNIAQDDIDAFLSEFEGADPATVSAAFIEQFVDPLTDERTAEEARAAAAAINDAIGAVLSPESGDAVGRAYINNLSDGARSAFEAQVGNLIAAGQAPAEAVESVLAPERANAIAAGYNTGLEEGIDFSAASEKAVTEAESINDLVGLTLGIGSPSTVTTAFGEDYGAGLESGLTTGFAGIPALVAAQGATINEALQAALNPADAETAGRQYIEGLNRGLGTAVVAPTVTGGGGAGGGATNRTTNITINNPTTRNASRDATRIALLDRLAGES